MLSLPTIKVRKYSTVKCFPSENHDWKEEGEGEKTRQDG